MLSRTASELYWMARYLERAESIVRVLDVTYKLSLMPIRSQQNQDLNLPLSLTGTHALFEEHYTRLTITNLLNFFVLDHRNPSSIYNCFQAAWNNAHSVRGSLSAEVWESINATWIEMKLMRSKGVAKVGTDTFFDWAKERAHLFRGAMFGTLLRNDALCFIRLGTLIERAYATAQLLGVKDQQLDVDPDPVREYYRLDTLLRAVSAREAYHSLYKHPVSRETVAELLVLRNDMPRSLRACVGDMVLQLERIGGQRANIPRRLAHTLHVELRFSTLDEVLAHGLQAYMVHFQGKINGLADSIHHTYLEAL
ncbi:alpha-E domain-containing protein [Biostraticola tofi]|uniref:Putative alpha-E superfamily protein n=1 Tax=Biostraticola tofi TaxID=466109 RepID=A0A4R3YIH5_9GAMM|nr:alpha-E domain-containing protein [Biostraticola tofi]TCV92465.1 putative alpha-E superfamily protein [Biostraticola tofi]